MSPGGTIGTMTIAGGYTQGAGGTLSIEVSPTAASQLKVGGAAKLDGTLALVFDPGIYSATSYKLLTASGVSGTFSTVTGANPSGLPQALLYDPADVTLALSGTPAKPVVVAPTNDTIYSAVTSTAILTAQQANGIILDRLGQRQAGIADGQVAAATPGGSSARADRSGGARRAARRHRRGAAAGRGRRLVPRGRRVRLGQRQLDRAGLYRVDRRVPRRVRPAGRAECLSRRRRRLPAQHDQRAFDVERQRRQRPLSRSMAACWSAAIF